MFESVLSSYWKLEQSREIFRDDVIHSPGFRLSSLTDSFVNTKAFSRLADLKQLGTAYWQFTSATHTRYAHSLGVAHLAQQWSDRIFTRQAQELGIEPRDLEIIELAGACHDLGHGPFSHVFEKEILPGLNIDDFHHEDMSCKMMEAAQNEAGIDEGDHDFTSADLRKAQQLIKGSEPHGGRPLEKAFMFDIVANSRNGLDVDKLDYLLRDAYHTKSNIPGDFKRLQHFISVSGDEICFEEAEWSNVQAVYDARRRMHQDVYQHSKVIAVGKMVADMLVAAEPFLGLKECIHDPERFMHLGDSVLQTVYSQHMMLQQGSLRIMDPEDEIENCLKSAVAIWDRIQKQDLYFLVGECVRPVTGSKVPDPAEIMKHSHSSGQLLKEGDIIVHAARIDYSQKDKNPMDSVRFINRDGRSVAYQQDDFTLLLTKQYQEQKLMVFSRSNQRDAQDALRDAWTHWCGSNDLGKAKNTPNKGGRHRPLKRLRSSTARTLQLSNGNGTIAEGIEPADDEDQEGYLSCSQEYLPLSQGSMAN